MNEDELLDFPPEDNFNQVTPLTDRELITVRKMIADYENKTVEKAGIKANVADNTKVSTLFTSEVADEPKVANNLFAEEPITPSTVSPSGLFFTEDSSSNVDNKQDFSELLDCCKNYDSSEAEIIREFKEIVSKLDNKVEKTLITAFLGLFPCKRFIRHGTTEQKLFVLKTLSDRFLENLAGIRFPERRKLLKVIAKYLSDVSENFNFIPMEGEPFKPTFHERVAGSSSSGLIVKEMRSFLVVDSRTNKIIYTGLVLS